MLFVSTYIKQNKHGFTLFMACTREREREHSGRGQRFAREVQICDRRSTAASCAHRCFTVGRSQMRGKQCGSLFYVDARDFGYSLRARQGSKNWSKSDWSQGSLSRRESRIRRGTDEDRWVSLGVSAQRSNKLRIAYVYAIIIKWHRAGKVGTKASSHSKGH